MVHQPERGKGSHSKREVFIEAVERCTNPGQLRRALLVSRAKVCSES